MTGLLRGVNKILIALLLLWGALALLARLAAPLLENARLPLQDALSQQFNIPIKIQRVHASWYGASPVLRLQDIQIGQGEQSLRINEARVDLTLGGLKSGHLLDSLRLTLDKFDLHIQREKNGQVHIAGLPQSIQNDNQGEPLQLPNQLRLQRTRLLWHDKRVQAKPLVINNLSLDLRRQANQLKLRGQLHSPLGNADFSADIDGYLRDTEWSGNSYLRIDKLQLAEAFRHYLPDHYRINSGSLHLELWQQWNKALPTKNTGSIQLTHTQLSNSAKQAHIAAIDLFSTDFHFQRDQRNNWTLELDQLKLQAKDKTPWPTGRLVAQLQRRDGKGAKLELAAEYLSIEELTQILLIRPPNEQIQKALQSLQLKGIVRDLRLELPLEETDANWKISAELEQFTNQAWGTIPGIRNLDGQIAAQRDQLQFDIDSREIELDYRSLFRDTHLIDELVGTLYWQSNGEKGWTVFSHELTLDTSDFTSKTQLQLTQPTGLSPHLYVQTEMQNANVAKVSRYLPAKTMGPHTVDWLDKSLSTGHVDKATLLLDGPLSSFPYVKPRNGVFEIIVNAQNTALDYQEGWPPLKALDARIEFHEKSLDISANKGQVFNSKIQQVQVSIHDLEKTSPLVMKGWISGPLTDHLSMLQAAPLREDFGDIGKALKAKGNAELRLAAVIPLDEGIGKYMLDGKLIFKQAQLDLPDWQLQLKKITGQLNISLDALQAKGIKAQALGTEITVDVVPQPDHSTAVITRTNLNKTDIAKRLPQVPLQNVQGSANFDITLLVPPPSASSAYSSLSVSSDLKGMALDLPVPLGKTAETSQNLKVQIPITDKTPPVQIDYANKISAHFSQDWQQGDIRLLAGTAKLSDKKGYQLKGNFEYFDLAAWYTSISALLPAGQTSDVPWLAAIKAKELSLDGLSLNQANIWAKSQAGQISGKLDSTQISGDFRYPLNGESKLEARLSKTHLLLGNETENSVPTPGGPDPLSLPGIDLICDDLKINQANLGRLHLRTHPAGTGLTIDSLGLQGGEVELEAVGTWTLDDYTPHTQISGELKSADLGELLHKLGYPRQIHDAAASSEFDLSWIGHPGQAHKETITGTIDLAIHKGRLSEFDPGVGRVLGLLSLNSIGRRLKLDFGDVLKKGYTFDNIAGSFRLEEGNAYTNDLNMNGPSGRINVGGRIGLVDRDFDQLVQITPNLDATLPIASTLAGGPVAGIATLLAQTLLHDKVDKINRFEYGVSGSWEEPKIQQLDSGGTLSKFLNALSGKKTQAKTSEQENLIAPRNKLEDTISPDLNTEPSQSSADSTIGN